MKKNALYIPFDSFQTIGGPATFMKNLCDYLKRNSFNYLKKHKKAQLIFFPVAFDHAVLDSIKKRGGQVIQRLDGIYYPSKHGPQYEQLNFDLQKIYLKTADFIIFQSQYSRRQCFSLLGEKNADQYKIIINGVNKKIFYPNQQKKSVLNQKVKLITTGNFRNIDMIEPVVQALDEIWTRQDFLFELNVVGPVVNPDLKAFFSRPYINLLGNRDLNGVARTLRENDIFIYSHLNPPCPNSVLEAIACGLPVVGFDSGSMRELLFFNRELLAPVKDTIFQEYPDFKAARLVKVILHAVNQYCQVKEKALANSHLYSFDQCGDQYLEIFRHFLEKNQTRTRTEHWARQIINHLSGKSSE